MFNDDVVTLYNVYAEDGVQKYNRTYLYLVDWQKVKAIKFTEKGIGNDEAIKVFIPYDSTYKTYVKPKQFSKLDDKSSYFTFKVGDIIVNGEIDFDITGIGTNTLKVLESSYDDVATITSIIDCNILDSWEVGAK